MVRNTDWRDLRLLLYKLIGIGGYTGFQYAKNESYDYSDRADREYFSPLEIA
jgi:hypothetical protein